MGDSSAEEVLLIAGSPGKLRVLVALGLLMTALSVVVAVLPLGWFMRGVGGIGAVFFGFATLVSVRRLFDPAPVLRISNHGLRDRRVAAEDIPWSAVRKVSTWEYQGQRTLVLDVAPEVEQTLGLTRIAKWSRGANRALGADGLCITAQGLTISHDELVRMVEKRLRRTNGG